MQETHGGDDVGIWATGPMAHLFHATHQQTHIGKHSRDPMYIGFGSSPTLPDPCDRPTHRLNMELDLQSLFGLHVT
jgi:hypothetical protein